MTLNAVAALLGALSGASFGVLIKGERETRVTGNEARGATGRRKKRFLSPSYRPLRPDGKRERERDVWERDR